MSAIFLRSLLLFAMLIAVPLSHAQAKGATTILLFGDSIIAGYGLSAPDSLTAQLNQIFMDEGSTLQAINGGLSGDTTSGGLSRLEWTLDKHNPDIVFIALGGNDVLRGFKPAITRKNIEAMLALLENKDVKVILSKVQAPANLGIGYMLKFNAIYEDLADEYDVPLYPFLLEDTFNNRTLMQRDGIHPNAEGVKLIAQKLGEYFLDE